jgi:hypothetical protein
MLFLLFLHTFPFVYSIVYSFIHLFISFHFISIDYSIVYLFIISIIYYFIHSSYLFLQYCGETSFSKKGINIVFVSEFFFFLWTLSKKCENICMWSLDFDWLKGLMKSERNSAGFVKCACLCVYVCMCTHMYVCMYVCMCVCMYVPA